MGIELILITLLFGAILAWIIKNRTTVFAIALCSSIVSLIIALFYYLSMERTIKNFQFYLSYEWISAWKVNFSIGFDHINAPFVLLTTFITVVAIALSIKVIKDKISSYIALILLLSFFVNAFFMSTNLLQFFFFYEAMLIPSVLLIQRWGGKNSYQAAIKFLIYTFSFSVFLFIAILATYFYGGGFDFESLANLRLNAQSKLLVLFGFILAFFVKIPIIPLHGWLRDTYYESPMPVTIFMSAVLGKMGIYGILRIIPYFGDIIPIISQWIIGLCLISFVYSAFLALSVKDIKVMLSYMSLSHVGIITAGVFTGNIQGYQGALLQSINHGILSAGLFYIAELLYRHTGSFDSEKFGALSKKIPALSFFTFALIMAMGGFPGLNYFNGELLLLSGIFRKNILLGFLSILGIAIGVIYLSSFLYRVFLRKPAGELSFYVKDVISWERFLLALFFLISIYFGLVPDFILSGVREIILFGGRG
ncbi:MAG: NADH-quinone oxidoreductase subunit M [Thermodesulfovibrio sp.]